MGDRQKKPSAFKNILIVMLCAVFAAFYMAAASYLYTSWQSPSAVSVSESIGDEDDALPAWSERDEAGLETQEDSREASRKAEAPEVAEGRDAVPEQRTVEGDDGLKDEAGAAQEAEDETEAKNDIVVGSVQTVEQAETARAVVTDVTAVVKAAMPCVVAITNEYTAYDYWYGGEYEEEACGSGIIISQNEEELLILTNYHVVEDADSLFVKFVDDTEVEAYTKGAAVDDDLALVSVLLSDIPSDTAGAIALAVLGDSDALEVGEPAIAIGNSLGYGQSVTTGVISALNCNIFEDDEYISLKGLIQTDAAINPGNSGGALLNINGEVIGISSSKIADYAIEGMGYAIPINTAKPIVDELVQQETKRKASDDKRAFLGISGMDVSEDAVYYYEMPAGVYVSEVLEGTAADKAGIIKGDIITAVGSEQVVSITGLQNILAYYEAGETEEITLMRMQNGSYVKKTVTVTFGLKE